MIMSKVWIAAIWIFVTVSNDNNSNELSKRLDMFYCISSKYAE